MYCVWHVQLEWFAVKSVASDTSAIAANEQIIIIRVYKKPRKNSSWHKSVAISLFYSRILKICHKRGIYFYPLIEHLNGTRNKDIILLIGQISKKFILPHFFFMYHKFDKTPLLCSTILLTINQSLFVPYVCWAK